MKRRLNKILATLLTLCMFVGVFTVPMTVNAAAPQDETYEAYDVVNYLDLKDASGNALSGTGTNLAGGTTFTYNRTSPTGSAILKYRWTVGQSTGQVAGYTGAEMNLSFEEVNGNAAYMFGALFTANAVNYRPYNGFGVNLQKTLVSGSIHDIEFAKLKVKTGANTGKYYVYLKIDGEIIAENYTNIDDIDENGDYTTQPGNTTRSVLSNKIFFACHGTTGNKISQIPDYTYEDYDTVTYSDLKDASGNALSESGTNMAGGTVLKYNHTSPTGSAILKYRLFSGNLNGYAPFQISFEKSQKGTINYKFSANLSAPTTDYPNGSTWILANNEVFANPFVIESNKTYDVEFARLKIKSGRNAGMYHIYLKINNVLFAERYVEANVVDTNGNYKTNDGVTGVSVLSGEILYACHGVSDAKISEIPEEEIFDTYDELTLSDLGLNPGDFQNALPGTASTYKATSASYSYVLKFNWRANLTPGTDEELCVSPDGEYNHGAGLWMRGQNFLFCYQKDWAKIILPAITSGDHLIEFGRKKVLNGKNQGKYYVYVMVDGVLSAESYETYLSPNNTIFVRGNALNKQRFSDYVYSVEYEPYDEIGYKDLSVGGVPLSSTETALSGTNTLTYDCTSPTGSVILKYRWTVGTAPKFQLSLGKVNDTVAYSFCAWMDGENPTLYPNGRIWLCPGEYNREANCAFALAPNSSHNVEFARLKIKNGSKKGQYHIYIKIDGVLFNEVYAPANTVDANGYFHDYRNIDNSVTSGEIFTAFNGSQGNKISEYKEIPDYTPGDIDNSGKIDADDLELLVKIILGKKIEGEVSSEAADFNNDGNVDILDLVSMKMSLAGIGNVTDYDMVSLQIGADQTKRTVVWCSDGSNEGKVQLALKSNVNSKIFPSNRQEFNAVLSDNTVSGKKTNTAVITGLSPNTEYAYRVGSDNKWSKIYTFTTGSFEDNSLSFLAVGDSQLGITNLGTETQTWADTIAKGLDKQPNASFMISLGDQVNAANNEEQFKAFFTPDALKSLPVATVVGNHEFTATNYSDHFKMPNVSSYGVSATAGNGTGDYWYIYNNVLFMCINSNNDNSDEHEEFMTAVISANPDVRWKVVTMHHSMYSVGHGILSTPDKITALRNSLSPLFSELGIDVVLSAHDHRYSRTYMMDGTTPVVPDGGTVPSSVTNPQGQVLYISLSSSSGSMYLEQSSENYSYNAVKNQENVPQLSVVDVTENSFKITTYRTNNMTVLDEFTIYKTN